MTQEANANLDAQLPSLADGGTKQNGGQAPVLASDGVPSCGSASDGMQPESDRIGTPDQPLPASTEQVLTTVIRQQEEMLATLKAFGQEVQSLARQQEFLQNGMRHLGNRVTDAAGTLSAPRIRDLFMRLLLLYDLVAPAPAGSSSEVASLCDLLAGQIEQFLQVNEFNRIPTDGCVFDNRLHKPVQVEVVQDPSLDGRVLRTLQIGFQSSQAVLRPAAVVIGRLGRDPLHQEDTGNTGEPLSGEEGPDANQQGTIEEERSET